ncbi:methylthioribulose-1-phosphate dehydratase [Ectothiorhodospira shaposhnikovii]|uniref:methylthioribulose 1-phosphate dehydratase n=1 Tax=Ectothiorhodospira shaposhnikovii TaxID=1054 RepID=UPI0019089B06|nr:methylthioribulose 1-phosphate dehydratase [Ectothiorhodospira shaposhnikovii]MBK1672024.1 methylthioribulose-1-phosphate dehydratase [Ectothiorhodospira shaposhnikovii]
MEETHEHFEARAAQLISAGSFFYHRGWMPATAGNLSARLDDHRMVITESGRNKGELGHDGLMMVDLDGNVLSPGKQPSAETFLHIILYRRSPRIGAVIHTHSVSATVLSRIVEGTELTLTDCEVLRTLPGIACRDASITLPIFGNDQDIPQLAAQVDDHMNRHPDTPGYLIEGHGFYAWGRDVAEARHHVEAFEFLFDCELQLRSLKP